MFFDFFYLQWRFTCAFFVRYGQNVDKFILLNRLSYEYFILVNI